MTDNRKILNYQSEFDGMVRKICATKHVRVKIGDLEQLLKATKRCLKVIVNNQLYLGGEMCVEDEEIAEAFKRINDNVRKDKEEIATKVRDKLSKKYKVV